MVVGFESFNPASKRLDSLSDKLQAWCAACLQSAPNPSIATDSLRNDARSFFQQLVRNTKIVTEDGIVLTTKKAAHEETIAKLIQELEPAFCSRHASRANALYVLCGALEGVQSAKLSHNTTKLIGSFLTGHCSPIELEAIDGSLGHDEVVRDSAVVCLSALVKCRLAESDEVDVVEAIRTRLDLAVNGVVRRCAVAEIDREEYDHSQQGDGLSMLPRSRRSICFDLLKSAIDGVFVVRDQQRVLTVNISVKSRGDIAKFVSFTASCMHGESDPRCLIQLLDLLRAAQVAFAPFFLPSAAAAFPSRDVFDAVAPYYPVQFTPPPNDIHGITRERIHSALMSVLCEVHLGDLSGHDSMLNSTLSIILERLSPSEDDEPTNTTDMDIFEATQDLNLLLFRANDSNCCRLEESTMAALVTALFSAHTKSSFGFPGDGASKTKTVANDCRNIVSKIAFDLESKNAERLWNIFVIDTIRTQSSVLASSPQSSQGRASIAFIAAIAASGGSRTLRTCLDLCLPHLLDILQKEAHDEEKLAAAVYGIAAFFSSSRVAIHRANSEALAFHPHPLREYSSVAFKGICNLLDTNETQSLKSNVGKPKNFGVQIASVRAMESVLMASLPDHFLTDDLQRIRQFLDFLTNVVVASSRGTVDRSLAAQLDWEKACSRTLGNLLGRSLRDIKDESDQGAEATTVVEAANVLGEHLRQEIFQRLLTSVSNESADKTAPRFDRIALAFVCKDSLVASSKVVSLLVASLCSTLKRNKQGREAKCYARTLSFVFRHGGNYASKSFHELSSPSASATSEDILDILSSPDEDATVDVPRNGESRLNLDIGMSMLKLPATTEQLEEIAKLSQESFGFALMIRPAYETGMRNEHLIRLVERVSQVLPPLEDTDSITLCVSLPLLATALNANRRLRSGSGTQHSDMVVERLEVIAAPLTSYALSLEHNEAVRSAAVWCLREIIKGCPPEKAEPLPSRLISEIIVPFMQDVLQCVSPSQDLGEISRSAKLRDSLFLLGSLGSVAACAGFKSEAADEVTRFLVEVACYGNSRLPFAVKNFDFTVGGKFIEWQFVSSSAFGSMLSVDDAGPFWKQRLVHVALRYIDLPVAAKILEVDQSSNCLPRRSPGFLNVICQLIALTRIGTLGKGTVKAIARQIVVALVSSSYVSIGIESIPPLSLVLSATIKLLCEATVMMSECISLVVLSLARLVRTSTKHDYSEIQTELLVLQALATISQKYRGNKSLELCKAAVLAVLNDQLNHPSRLLRNAAVHVRNEWSVIG